MTCRKKILRTAERDIRKRRKMKIVFIALLASAAIFAGLPFPFDNDVEQSQQPQLAKTDTTLGKPSTVLQMLLHIRLQRKEMQE